MLLRDHTLHKRETRVRREERGVSDAHTEDSAKAAEEHCDAEEEEESRGPSLNGRALTPRELLALCPLCVCVCVCVCVV